MLMNKMRFCLPYVIKFPSKCQKPYGFQLISTNNPIVETKYNITTYAMTYIRLAYSRYIDDFSYPMTSAFPTAI